MNQQKHKLVVRIVCLVIAVLMVAKPCRNGVYGTALIRQQRTTFTQGSTFSL